MSTETAQFTPEAAPAPPLAPVELFLQRLARAVYQFRIYPPASPFRVEAISAAHASLTGIERRDRLEFRITHREIIVDDTGVGKDSIVERELVRRLHAASIGQLRIQCDATAEDLTQFCSALVQTIRAKEVDLVDLLLEAGVGRIEAQPVHRPEVVELVKDTGPVYEQVRRDWLRHAAAAPTSQPVHHLYPPDRGWIRVDPTSTINSVSLPELAVLVEDPPQLAGILLRLTGDDAEAPADVETALARKYADLATVFASLEPEIARAMFGRLARAVLQLDDGRRAELLKRAVLPGLLDGQVEGRILQDFPDAELADALSLLLDLETAVPEVLTVALTRIEIPDERRKTVLPMMRDRLERSNSAQPVEAQARALDRYARQLIQVAAGQPTDFAEFAAFDTSLDGAAVTEIARIREVTAATAGPDTQVGCLCGLIRLEASPERVDTLLHLAMTLIGELQAAAQWSPTVAWLTRLREISVAVAPRRPQVAERISAAFAGFVTCERASQLAELHASGPEARPVVASYVGVTSDTLAGAITALLDDKQLRTNVPALVDLMCEHADILAPGLVGQLEGHSPVATRAVIRALGHAGSGHEPLVAAQLGNSDPLVKREALQALARIGSRDAAAVIAAQVVGADPSLRTAAAEALWRLPPAEAHAELRHILGRQYFAVKHPEVVLQLLARAESTGAGALQAELKHLAAMRWRFWRPSLMRVASTARQLLVS
jgi:HEAT repeats